MPGEIMVDIASLAIKIDTSDTVRAEQALDKLATAGGKAEKAAEGVGAAWKDAGQGVSKAGTAASAATVGMTKAEQAAKRQAEVLKQAGLSAGQYSNAMRMLPMQLTDVVTSLSSGMPLWQVAIQQGGQVRDSFGGIGNAARAVTSAIPPATAALGAMAAAAAALLIAYQQGQNEAQAYNKALILTGSASGASAEGLAAMAESIDEVAGTQRAAAQALAEVAATGKFAADQIQGIATAAILMEQATGKAVSDTVKEFARLADEPSAAAAKLNEQYHFLTAAVFEQIAALEEQGRTTEAAKLATEAYASSVQQRAETVKANLGALQTAWLGIKSAAAEAWDAMLDIGREDTLEQKLASAQEAAQRFRSRGKLDFDEEFKLGELDKQIAFFQAQIAARDRDAKQAGVQAELQQAGVEAAKEIARIRDQSLSKAEQKEKAIAEYRRNLEKVRKANPNSDLLDQAQIDKTIKNIEARFEETAKRTKAYTDDAATRMLQGLRNQEAILQARLDGERKLTASQQAQVEFTQKIADLKEKRVLTADQKSLLANKDAIADQLAQNVALEDGLLKREQINELERMRIQILRSSGQTEAANAAQADLEFAKQRAEFERQGNAEAIKRLEMLKQVNAASDRARVKSGTVEGVSKAPAGVGVDAAVAGPRGEVARLNEQALELDQWRTSELEKQQSYLEAKAINEETYTERIRNIHDQHQQELSEIEEARQALSIETTATLFGGIADLTRVFAGEQSNAYKVMFAAQKAYSIASVLLSSSDAIGKAWASAPFPANLAAVATTVAETGALKALISGVSLSGMAHDGIDSVPKEGTWLLDKGERVVDSRTNADLKNYLAKSDGGQQASAPVININANQQKAGQVSSRQDDGRWVIDVFVADVMGDGRAQKAISQKFALQGVGR